MLLLSSFVPNLPLKAYADDSLNVNAKSAILIDATTGKILYEKNADVALPPASMSKMMTEYLVQKYIADGKLSWNTKVSISDYAYNISQNRAFSGVPLRKDYQYTVKELYQAMAIYSDNAATIAFAEKIAGSEANFVKLMNKQAKAFGMDHTTFVNSSGLNNSDLGKFAEVGGQNASNKMSARDLAKLAYHIVTEFPHALDISSIPRMNFTAGENSPVDMPNWNWMIPGIGTDLNQYSYPGVDGLKTGYTDLAGYCFTGTVKRDNRRLISVVMGTTSKGARFQETKKLFDYGFNQFSLKTIADKGYTFKTQKTLPVVKGKNNKVKIETNKPIDVIVANGEEKSYKPVLHLDKKVLNKDGDLIAPVKAGEKVGYVTVKSTGSDKYGYLYDNLQQQVPVVTAAAVDKANWFVLTMKSIGHFISGIFSGAAHLITGLFK